MTRMLVIAVVAACGKDASKAPEQTPEPVKPTPKAPDKPVDKPKPAPRSKDPKPFEVKLEPNIGTPVKIKFTAPGDFDTNPYGASRKNEFGEAATGIQFTVTCDGECTQSKLPAALAKLVAHGPEGAKVPNFNTGDAKLDAVRLDVVTLEQGDIPGGKFITYRVTKPAGLDGPYREEFHGLCGRMHPDKERFVYAQVWTPIDKEKDDAPALLQACKTFEIAP